MITYSGVISAHSRLKQNSLEGIEERGRVTNIYLTQCDRKPIPDRRASEGEGAALPGGSPKAGDN